MNFYQFKYDTGRLVSINATNISFIKHPDERDGYFEIHDVAKNRHGFFLRIGDNQATLEGLLNKKFNSDTFQPK